MELPEHLQDLRGCGTPASPIAQLQVKKTSNDSISKDDESTKKPTTEAAHIWKCDTAVTSVALSHSKLYAGTVDGTIHVYDLETYQHVIRFNAHIGSILTLLAHGCYLLSGSSDSLVKIWDLDAEPPTLSRTIYCLSDIGDIFCMGFCADVLYFGTQNASLHWVDLESASVQQSTQPGPRHPAVRPNRFFDSAGPGGLLAPQQHQTRKLLKQGKLGGVIERGRLIEVAPESQISFAHESAVYSMAVDDIRKRVITGGGDGILKIWRIDARTKALSELYKVQTGDAILDMALANSWQLCVGLDSGVVLVVDLETLQVLRHDLPPGGDGPLLSLAAVEDALFVSRGSQMLALDSATSAVQSWDAPGLVTATITLPQVQGLGNLVTTGKDGSIALWNVPLGDNGAPPCAEFEGGLTGAQNSRDALSDDTMIAMLASLVSYQTISGRDRKYWSDCRRCATLLRDTMRLMGAESDLLRVENGNPIVLAVFKANSDITGVDGSFDADSSNGTNGQSSKAGRALFYGHYDVIEAPNLAAWNTPPFQLTSIDGYMYGRGVTDNKGPAIAAIFAVAELYAKRRLPNDVVFLLEGEEEAGSFGFRSTIEKHKLKIGHIDWIIFSNSYWINDTRPCLNYGLRGVVFVEIEITSGKGDLHSGVDGGLFREPAQDMIKLLSNLATDEGEISIPHFFDNVLPVTENEEKLYEDISVSNPSTSIHDLMHKWRFPSMTIHKFDVSGPGNQTVIPASVKAYISLRLVPNQTAAEIKTLVRDFLDAKFSTLRSTNSLDIRFKYDADPWLGEPCNAAFQILAKALEDAWGISPLFIREGGSVPVARALEKMFDAPAAQLPCGQSSDRAHLDNERLRVTNLLNTRQVFSRVFSDLCQRDENN